jgi:hypothetical protein
MDESNRVTLPRSHHSGRVGGPAGWLRCHPVGLLSQQSGGVVTTDDAGRALLRFVLIHDIRDSAPRSSDEKFTEVVLGRVGVRFNRLIK